MQSNFDEQIQSKHNPVSALDDHVVPDDHGAGVRSDVNQHPQGACPDGATGNAYTVSAIFRDVIKKVPIALVCLQKCLPMGSFFNKHWHRWHTNGKKFYRW